MPPRPNSHGSPKQHQRGANSPEHQQYRQGARSPGGVLQPPPPPSRPPPMFDKSGGVASRGSASAGTQHSSQQPLFSATVSAAIASAVAVAAAASRPMVAAGVQAPVSELTGPGGASSSSSAAAAARGTGIAAPPTFSAADRPAPGSSSSAAAPAETEGHSSASDKWSPLRPPPRLRWQDAATSGSGPATGQNGHGGAVPGDRQSISATAGLTDAGLQDCEPALRKKIKQALRDESLHRLRQKLLAESGQPAVETRLGTSALSPPERRATPADLSVEARAKNRARVRPLLPPKGPGWSTAGGSANMSYRPALAIEARSVHPPPGSASRPRASAAGDAQAPHAPSGSVVVGGKPENP